MCTYAPRHGRWPPPRRRRNTTRVDLHLRRRKSSGVHDVPRRVLALEADDVALVVLDEVVGDTTNMIFGVRRERDVLVGGIIQQIVDHARLRRAARHALELEVDLELRRVLTQILFVFLFQYFRLSELRGDVLVDVDEFEGVPFRW